MSKFKVGDKVKVVGRDSATVGWCEEMDLMQQKEGVISDVSTRDADIYEVTIDHLDCWFNGKDLKAIDKEEVVDITESQLTFPRMMQVGDDKDGVRTNKLVVAYLEDKQYPYIAADSEEDDEDCYSGYAYAEEIEEEKEIAINTIVEIIHGGGGALLANGIVGRVCTKEEAIKNDSYGGQCKSEDAELYVINQNGSYGLMPGLITKTLS